MVKELGRNIRLGLFVLIGTVFIIIAFYLLGNKQNLFGSTFKISANFKDVSGLQVGNNVRLGGINIGTVNSVEITSEANIKVEMIIEKKSRQFIRKNYKVSIGTDGLMGNKLINIRATTEPAEMVEEGDTLQTMLTMGTDEMLSSLNKTNEDVSVIAKNLRTMVERLNSPNALWSILMDTVLADNVKQAIVNIKLTSQRTAIITGDLSRIVSEVKSGKGSIGALLMDTSIAVKVHQTIVNINTVSDTLAYISGDLRNISRRIKNGEGAIGALLLDTTFVPNLNKSMENVKNTTNGFNEIIEALKHNFLLRSYFKKKEKTK
ncbi:MAG: MlaD family protein [Saprospiraceae bacterium]